MMDQYKNQYKEETSQIHAPADLLERTRQAVSEEEKRLQAENAWMDKTVQDGKINRSQLQKCRIQMQDGRVRKE